MIKLFFEKLYNTERIEEPCFVGIPLKKGLLYNKNKVRVYDCDKNTVKSQSKATAYWDDKSIKWIFIRFNATLPANKSIYYYCDFEGEAVDEEKGCFDEENSIIDTGEIKLKLSCEKNSLFDEIVYKNNNNLPNFITGPYLMDGDGKSYSFKTDNWELIEDGCVCTIVKGVGYHTLNDENIYNYEITLTAFKGKSWFEAAYRIINTTEKPLHISELLFKNDANIGKNVRSAVASSNYKTEYFISNNGESVFKEITAEMLKNEPNEHTAEVYYGTFFADRTSEKVGLCAAVFQAYQNYPKAVKAGMEGMEIMLVPKDNGRVIMQSGMAREQKVLFYFHDADESIESINNRSIIYQMPDRPALEPSVFEKSGVFEDIFTKNRIPEIELFLELRADNHGRSYGMMNWGDSPDMGYTSQGRGKGDIVWSNNEYDYPHACALMYARTCYRKYLDYLFVSARHWMDVDVCHYSKDPLLFEGQWEHTNGHCLNGTIVCSHQWVEGLLDYYHYTGDKTAFETAIGIGKNVLRLLETPMFSKSGQANARETGWALRTLSALYKETNDKSWLEKCEWIVGHFIEWEKEYGHWLAPYTDNTSIRVVFMISIAVGSLMRYYRISKNDIIKDMIIRSVDDLIENSIMDTGLFYYKELPSLKRPGSNPIILEALEIAYELTGDIKYMEVGVPTFKYITKNAEAKYVSKKEIVQDAVLVGTSATKGFAQLMLPVTLYYTKASELGLIK